MKEPLRISDAEWEVMSVIWGSSPVAAMEITEKLRRRKQWTLATVRTFLRRLVRKKVISQQPDGKRFLYVPRLSMEECVRQESDSFWDRVVGHAPSATLVHLVEKADLSQNE